MPSFMLKQDSEPRPVHISYCIIPRIFATLLAEYLEGQPKKKEMTDGNMNGGSYSEAASLVGTAFKARRLRILMVGAG